MGVDERRAGRARRTARAKAELESQIEQLRGSAADARAREHEVRKALRQLAEARPWQRRAVMAELAGRGLL